jgi:hypothetical protein
VAIYADFILTINTITILSRSEQIIVKTEIIIPYTIVPSVKSRDVHIRWRITRTKGCERYMP